MPKTLIIIAVVSILFLVAAFLVMHSKPFGSNPKAKRLDRIRSSSNFSDGVFHFTEPTPMMPPNTSYFTMIKLFFTDTKDKNPSGKLPSIHTDLKKVYADRIKVTWFGHSSLMIQAEGKTILVDPVFSRRSSPFSFIGTSAYPGTEFSLADLPKIDYVFFTHDHYDHLDYPTVLQLKKQDIHYYMPLGVGAHLERWGIDSGRIHELDWWEDIAINNDFTLISTPARHFSGRGLSNRNTTLWTSFVFKTKNSSIFIGGDSGYGKHFKEIGDKFGPFDLTLLESGQYNALWPYIHMMPEETAQAHLDLKGKKLLPVHWGKFSLAFHPWTDPIERLTKKAEELDIKMITPVIGQEVVIDSLEPDTKWWREQYAPAD